VCLKLHPGRGQGHSRARPDARCTTIGSVAIDFTLSDSRQDLQKNARASPKGVLRLDLAIAAEEFTCVVVNVSTMLLATGWAAEDRCGPRNHTNLTMPDHPLRPEAGV
jgi:hypothetical protein